MSGRALTVSVALGNVLVPLNSTMIVVALPQVARDLGVDVAATAWLVTAYLIAMASLQPVAGRLGDRSGRRRVMLAALAYFALASLGAALSPSFAPLVFFRLQQALAAATIVPNGFGLLRELLPAGGRGAEFGIVSGAASAGATLGPLVGGVLALVDWRWIFIVNLPVAAIAFATAWRVVPIRAAKPATRFDATGAAALAAVLLAGAWSLTSLGRGLDPVAVAIGLAAIPAAIALLRYEGRRADPAIPPAIFRVRPFAAACATVALQNVALYGTSVGLPIALAGPSLPYELLVAGLAFAGTGLGFTFPAMRVAALEAVPERDAALASGVFQTSRYFGGMFGTISVAIAAAASVADTRTVFAPLAVAALLATIPALGLQSGPAPAAVREEVAEEPIAQDVAG